MGDSLWLLRIRLAFKPRQMVYKGLDPLLGRMLPPEISAAGALNQDLAAVELYNLAIGACIVIIAQTFHDLAER
jgi:hypothetical protein